VEKNLKIPKEAKNQKFPGQLLPVSAGRNRELLSEGQQGQLLKLCECLSARRKRGTKGDSYVAENADLKVHQTGGEIREKKNGIRIAMAFGWDTGEKTVRREKRYGNKTIS